MDSIQIASLELREEPQPETQIPESLAQRWQVELWAGVMSPGFLVSDDPLKVPSKEHWGMCAFSRGEVHNVHQLLLGGTSTIQNP